jgi:hypothetical protein
MQQSVLQQAKSLVSVRIATKMKWTGPLMEISFSKQCYLSLFVLFVVFAAPQVLGSSLPDAVTSVTAAGAFHETLVIAQLVLHLKQELQGVDIGASKLKPSFIQYILSKIKTVVISSSSLEKDQLKDLLIQVLGQLVVRLAPAETKVVEDVFFDLLVKNKLVKAVDHSLKGRFTSLFKKHG